MNSLAFLVAVLVLACAIGFLNAKTLRLPPSITMLAAGFLASLGVIILGTLFPSLAVSALSAKLLQSIDFPVWFLQGVLPVLLFAGALELDLAGLFEQKGPVLTLSFIATAVSTLLIGLGTFQIFRILGIPIAMGPALLFGALISPTDPIAVLGVLKSMKVAPRLETIIAGESLFNDGIAVVFYSVILSAVTGGAGMSALSVVVLFLRQACGGLFLGLVLGWIAFHIIKRIDEPNVEILVTVTLVMALIWLGIAFSVSAALSAVVAGLFIGNPGRRFGMSAKTREALDTVWSFGDYALNALLFVFLGLEVLGIGFKATEVWPSLIVIPLTLAVRFVSVAAARIVPGVKGCFSMPSMAALVWGGLRGGIPVALALSLPPFTGRHTILQATYVVVVFSILVQGLSFPSFVRYLLKRGDLQKFV